MLAITILLTETLSEEVTLKFWCRRSCSAPSLHLLPNHPAQTCSSPHHWSRSQPQAPVRPPRCSAQFGSPSPEETTLTFKLQTCGVSGRYGNGRAHEHQLQARAKASLRISNSYSCSVANRKRVSFSYFSGNLGSTKCTEQIISSPM